MAYYAGRYLVNFVHIRCCVCVSVCPWGYANRLGCSLFSTCMKNVIRLRGCAQRQMSNRMSGIVPQSTSSSCCYYISTGYCKPKYTGKSVTKTNSCSSVIGFQASQGSCFGYFILKQSNWQSLTVKNVVNSRQAQKICFDFSSQCRSMNVKLLVPNQGIILQIKCNVGLLS